MEASQEQMTSNGYMAIHMWICGNSQGTVTTPVGSFFPSSNTSMHHPIIIKKISVVLFQSLEENFIISDYEYYLIQEGWREGGELGREKEMHSLFTL